MPQPDDQQELAPWEVWSYHNNYDYKWWWNPSAEALDEARKRFAARMKKIREAEEWPDAWKTIVTLDLIIRFLLYFKGHSFNFVISS